VALITRHISLILQQFNNETRKTTKMELKRFTKLIFAILFLLGISNISLKANNLNISAPTVVGANLQFTISWDNSWNASLTPSNWDGVWVFVKRQACVDNLWTHALVSTVSADHSVTGGILQVDAVADGMGVFIRRSALGNGNIAAAQVTLALQTAANAVDNFQVFGMEMVNIPQGDFLIGDNINGFGQGSGSNAWGFKNVLITNAIQTAGIGAVGNYKSNGTQGIASLPATYPLGWNSFYSMKYEISQEQYVSFLNSLTFTQQLARTAVNPASGVGTIAIANATNPSRNRIKIKTSGVTATTPAVYGCDLNNNGVFDETDDGQNIACNWLAWSDLMAYLDWAALRPMTEFEFEKICRGAAPASLNGEYAWSAVSLTQAISSSLNNPGDASETATASGNGLCVYGGSSTANGPLRCGFAAGAATNKAQAGGSWWGVMEMSGNVWEQCVGGYNFNYSTFTTACGDGSLTAAGAANTANWPPAGGGNFGGVLRGGGYDSGATTCRISENGLMTYNGNQGRVQSIGGRGVR
jgi:formylglycine-generating enzyme required for sulfatase activity